MPNHVETLLTTLGIPAEEATKILTLPEEEQKTFDATPYAEKVKANYQTQLQNDPAFFNDMTLEKLPSDIKKKVESSQYARATNVTKEKIAKGFGFTEDQMKKFSSEDFKALEYWLPAVIDEFSKTKVSDKEVQNQLIEARKKLEEFNGYEEKVKTKYENEANQKVTSAIFRANLIGELSSIPGLKIPAADIANAADTILNSKYAFEKVGDYGVELRQKTNPTMKVLKQGSSQELTLKEALTEIATERGWVEKEKPGGTGSGTIEVAPNGKGELEMYPAHLRDTIRQKIATQKQ